LDDYHTTVHAANVENVARHPWIY